MAYSPSDFDSCKTRIASLVDALLAELGCDHERFEALCAEFSEATEKMQEQLAGQAERYAEWHVQRMSAEMLAQYEQGIRLYDTYMTGFLVVLGERRRRFGLDQPAA